MKPDVDLWKEGGIKPKNYTIRMEDAQVPSAGEGRQFAHLTSGGDRDEEGHLEGEEFQAGRG